MIIKYKHQVETEIDIDVRKGDILDNGVGYTAFIIPETPMIDVIEIHGRNRELLNAFVDKLVKDFT